jgi:hypothetical protein
MTNTCLVVSVVAVICHLLRVGAASKSIVDCPFDSSIDVDDYSLAQRDESVVENLFGHKVRAK